MNLPPLCPITIQDYRKQHKVIKRRSLAELLRTLHRLGYVQSAPPTQTPSLLVLTSVPFIPPAGYRTGQRRSRRSRTCRSSWKPKQYSRRVQRSSTSARAAATRIVCQPKRSLPSAGLTRTSTASRAALLPLGTSACPGMGEMRAYLLASNPKSILKKLDIRIPSSLSGHVLEANIKVLQCLASIYINHICISLFDVRDSRRLARMFSFISDVCDIGSNAFRRCPHVQANIGPDGSRG